MKRCGIRDDRRGDIPDLYDGKTQIAAIGETNARFHFVRKLNKSAYVYFEGLLASGKERC